MLLWQWMQLTLLAACSQKKLQAKQESRIQVQETDIFS
jgi:hypothetical protein